MGLLALPIYQYRDSKLNSDTLQPRQNIRIPRTQSLRTDCRPTRILL